MNNLRKAIERITETRNHVARVPGLEDEVKRFDDLLTEMKSSVNDAYDKVDERITKIMNKRNK